MSEDLAEQLEKHKKDYVVFTQQINQMQQQLQQLTVARERKFGMIQILEDQVKKMEAFKAEQEKEVES